MLSTPVEGQTTVGQPAVYVGLPSASKLVATQEAILPLSSSLVMFGWPTTTSAACPFCVGMEFQINTRLWPRSVTYRRCPSEVTDTGSNRLLAVGGRSLIVAAGTVEKFGSPKTK